MSVGKGTTVHRLVSDGQSISTFSVKTAKTKIPVTSVFNDSEGLDGTTVWRYPLVRRPHYSARLILFGSRGPSEFARDCVGRSRTGTRHGNVNRSVREKREMLFIGNVFYKQ